MSTTSQRLCVICQTESRHKCGKCNNVYYCSLECQRSDWVIHKETCGKESDNTEYVEFRNGLAFAAKDIPDAQKLFTELAVFYYDPKKASNKMISESFDALDENSKKWLLSLRHDPTLTSELAKIKDIMKKNSIQFSQETNFAPEVYAVFTNTSKLPHSCIANCLPIVAIDGRPIIQIMSARPIPKGTPLTISYTILPWNPYRARQIDIIKRWGFVCDCPLCKIKTNVHLQNIHTFFKRSIDIRKKNFKLEDVVRLHRPLIKDIAGVNASLNVPYWGLNMAIDIVLTNLYTTVNAPSFFIQESMQNLSKWGRRMDAYNANSYTFRDVYKGAIPSALSPKHQKLYDSIFKQ